MQAVLRALVVMCGAATSHAAYAAELAPASETGVCSLEDSTPVIVASVEDDLDMTLDDGRRIVVSGLDFAQGQRSDAQKRLRDWLVGKQSFLGIIAAAPDRWGRIPARLFAPANTAAEAPLVAVGAALLNEGLARFRPDSLAAACAKLFLAAERSAREDKRGLWAADTFAVIDVSKSLPVNQGLEAFFNRKGMILVEGIVDSIGESHGALYLNFGHRRGRDFAVVISKRNLAMFEQAGVSVKALKEARVRVRGLIETSFGARMDVSSPMAMEILDTAQQAR